MEIFVEGVGVLKMIVGAMGAGVMIWGFISLCEGYASENPGSKATGLKLGIAGGGMIAIALGLIPMLADQLTI